MNDPREVLASTPMRWQQAVVVAITTGLSALDGFDLLAISFAAPGIAGEWHVDRARLGVVLSMELLGMSLGAIGLGRLADRFGRRPLIHVCLLLMASGMFAAALARGPLELSLWRLLTGFGIGGMLAIATALTSEFSNRSRREQCISLMAIGYPIGVSVGGTACAVLLRHHDWRSIFYLGGTMTAAFIPVVTAFAPESVQWLATKQPPRALQRLNRSLARLGRDAVDALPDLNGPHRASAGAHDRVDPLLEQHPTAARPLSVFSPGIRSFTVLATLAYCFHIFTYFYLLKWLPAILVDMGFSPSSAVGVLVWTNIGAIVGALLLSSLVRRLGLKTISIMAMVASTVAVTALGLAPANLAALSFLAAAAGVCITAGIIGVYAIFARGFPAYVRASGTGFGMGVGRIGSAVAPISAGVLFRNGYGVASVSTIMALGSLIAAATVLVLRFPADQSDSERIPREGP